MTRPATAALVPTDLGEDQVLLADTVNKLLAGQALMPDQAGTRPDGWPDLARLGLLDIAVGAEAGGSGGSGLDLFVIAEAVGRHLATVPWLGTALGAITVAAGGRPSLRAEVLPAVAAGDCRLAVASDSATSATGPHPTLRVTATDGGFILDGTTRGVVGGPSADRFVVVATPDESAGAAARPVIALVARGAAGLSEATYRTVDDRDASDLVFSALRLPAEHVLDRVPGDALAGMIVDTGAACLAAEAAGAMRAAVDLTVEHLRVRRQFGAQLASFQALRHRAVDMHVATEQVRAMALVACATLDGRDGRHRGRSAAAAKALAGRHGRLVGEQAVQLHGGIGMSMEHAVSHYLRRLVAIEAQGGGSAWHLRRLAEAASP
jgi:alkylation response protein AidB-like acyl-CoA dehydrogenase